MLAVLWGAHGAGAGPQAPGPTIVVAGDSIANGFRVEPTERFSALIAAFAPQARVFNVARPGLLMDRRFARSGPGGGLADRWEAEVLALDPAVIVLMMGTNDVRGPGPLAARLDRFDRALRGVLDAARAHANPDGTHPAVLLMSPPRAQDPAEVALTPAPYTSNRPRADLDALVARERGVAAAYPDVRWVDPYRAWEAFNRARGGGTWFVTHLTADGVHPNAAGHQLLFLVLRPYLADALAERGPDRFLDPSARSQHD